MAGSSGRFALGAVCIGGGATAETPPAAFETGTLLTISIEMWRQVKGLALTAWAHRVHFFLVYLEQGLQLSSPDAYDLQPRHLTDHHTLGLLAL